ncbi:MAG: iron-containing redox enzyme family protein [Gammaproteobacteria bacterium]|nr:iron-containing redox enzyme family protein [Gammaproteobacteria bacterium]
MSAITQLLEYTETLTQHAVFRNQYFSFLKTHKFTPELYAFHRANFFFRTEATVKSVAQVCAKAAIQDDHDTLLFFSYILNEECGNGDKSHCHELLMEQSHNIYGDKEYQLAPLKVKEAKFQYPNGLVILETKQYREKVNALLNKNYASALGVAYALETHASYMLTNFREIFAISRTKMTEKEYKSQVEIYFNVHLDSGIEDRHSEDSKQCILNNCKSDQVLSDMIFAINETLNTQQAMWSGMYREAIRIIS